ncbi:hypothetical protein PVK06_016704 [Gossypium arboreum]|uniref:Uncharacterized protein n=1 Tax=Gossypium arboreum TaxID=29729 RepID=A0ABR0Q1E9_GOSAR|nr:hypothetical protein PVK06_016704 [Gossypium arboreum]
MLVKSKGGVRGLQVTLTWHHSSNGSYISRAFDHPQPMGSCVKTPWKIHMRCRTGCNRSFSFALLLKAPFGRLPPSTTLWLSWDSDPLQADG